MLCFSRRGAAWPAAALAAQGSSGSGFALLITLVLMALVVLLAVSFAALTRCEIQLANNGQVQAQAQQHALMGLEIAVGQLQKYAGADARISASATLLDESVENPWFTGIWNANQASLTPLVWLVSGNEAESLLVEPQTKLGRTAQDAEQPLVLDDRGVASNGPRAQFPNTVRLVGSPTAAMGGVGVANGGVVVPGVPINLIPSGFMTERTVGRYAYWVGDQGVKASIGLADRSQEVNYPPWLTAAGEDQRNRIRQQIATTPSYFQSSSAGRFGFDPLGSNNDALRVRLLELNQCQFLTPVAAAAPLAGFLHEHYHDFTTRAYSVLANTLPDENPRRGLLCDLSVKPTLLGAAFAAHVNYPAYMETPALGNTAVPSITTAASARRRYNLYPVIVTPATQDAPAIEFGVAPILASFLLQFRVVRIGSTVQVRSRLFTELWNPYTAAWVPPANLALEITGLPKIQITDTGPNGGSVNVDLQALPIALAVVGGASAPMRVSLPFVVGAETDRASWLPGRIYAWVTAGGAAPTATLNFYSKNMSAQGWAYPATTLAGTSGALQVSGAAATRLSFALKLGNQVLGTYTSPDFPPVLVPNVEEHAASGNWVFGFGCRLKQPSALNKERDWLSRTGVDFRNQSPPACVFAAFNENLDLDPEAYTGTPATSTGVNNFLLYRAAGVALGSTRSANNDAPVFELPRLPHLSLGELQHLCFSSGRPFALGNSWGDEVRDLSGCSVNSWFDRFFLSGISAAGSAPDIRSGVPLPNFNLVPVASPSLGSASLSLDELRDGGSAYTTRFLLQAGGFNVNSTSPAAWRAVLSGVRFSGARPFMRMRLDEQATPTVYTGSQAGEGSEGADECFADATLDADEPVGGPTFFRFPQSAQETYACSNGAIDGLLSKTTFRQGVRGGSGSGGVEQLTVSQVELMAQAIASLVRINGNVGGPFRSMEEFLAPHACFGGASLLEKAIADSGINPASISTHPVSGFTDPGFSSLTLTQADIMTALAPYLRTRSDTFVVRAYGEVVNPATASVTGRAWCEAVVQRFPEPIAKDDDVVAPSVRGFGRRFKIIQFRWLSSSDI